MPDLHRRLSDQFNEAIEYQTIFARHQAVIRAGAALENSLNGQPRQKQKQSNTWSRQ
jgi:hypothetical protein